MEFVLFGKSKLTWTFILNRTIAYTKKGYFGEYGGKSYGRYRRGRLRGSAWYSKPKKTKGWNKGTGRVRSGYRRGGGITVAGVRNEGKRQIRKSEAMER